MIGLGQPLAVSLTSWTWIAVPFTASNLSSNLQHKLPRHMLTNTAANPLATWLCAGHHHKRKSAMDGCPCLLHMRYPYLQLETSFEPHRPGADVQEQPLRQQACCYALLADIGGW